METPGKKNDTGAIEVVPQTESVTKRPLEWQVATVKAINQETQKAKTITLALPDWTPHKPGQHYDVRLTAPDGYQTQRSYSVASEPGRIGEIDLTVEKLDDGEVSTYLHDILGGGDQIEVRGPIGGYFVWDVDLGGPLLLIAGGSGIVPLMAMIRHRATVGSQIPVRLLYSVRSPDDVFYFDELMTLRAIDTSLEVFYTFTRQQPEGWDGYSRRIDEQMLKEVTGPFGKDLRAYICGPTLLVESAANDLVKIGIPAAQIRTERFGPTGSSAS